MSEKEEYKSLCERENSIPIFLSPWWMNAVCGEENWDVILIKNDSGIIAAMPYYLKKKFNFKYITQPLLTHKGGLWIKYPLNQKYSRRLSYQNHIVEEVIEQLEKLDIDSFAQNFDYEFQNWLPFYWKGFKEQTNYSYIIEDISNLDQVCKNFESSTRNSLKKAEKQVKVSEDIDLKQFYHINKMSFDRQNIPVPYSYEFVKNLDEACVRHSCRKMLCARDEQDRIHAVSYIVWDNNSAYGLMGGANPELRNSDAHTFINWEIIKFASTVTKRFDFGGSMIEPIERSFRGFGGILKPYFTISKEMKKSHIFRTMKHLYFNNLWLRDIYNRLKE